MRKRNIHLPFKQANTNDYNVLVLSSLGKFRMLYSCNHNINQSLCYLFYVLFIVNIEMFLYSLLNLKLCNTTTSITSLAKLLHLSLDTCGFYFFTTVKKNVLIGHHATLINFYLKLFFWKTLSNYVPQMKQCTLQIYEYLFKSTYKI